MRKLIRKLLLGTAAVLVLGIGGAALDYAADTGNPVNPATMPPAAQTSDSLLTGDASGKMTFAGRRSNFAIGDSTKGRLMASWVPRRSGPSVSSKRTTVWAGQHRSMRKPGMRSPVMPASPKDPACRPLLSAREEAIWADKAPG